MVFKLIEELSRNVSFTQMVKLINQALKMSDSRVLVDSIFEIAFPFQNKIKLLSHT